MTANDLVIYHTPVMAREVIHYLRVRPGGVYGDLTCGEGGHSLTILEAAAPDSRLLCLDADPDMLALAAIRLQAFSNSVTFANSNFAHSKEVARERGLDTFDGLLMDLGISSRHLEITSRGFSFLEGPLDSRLNPRQELTAEEIVNTYDEKELAEIFATYGEDPRARRIAAAIVQSRPIASAPQLAEVVSKAAGGRSSRSHLHPATRIFQALRYAVNDEVDNVRAGLQQAVGLLAPAGRLVVLAYESLTDREVKTFFKRESTGCVCPPQVVECQCGHRATLRLVSRRVVTPSQEEVRTNPRSRSARLRVVERL